MPVKSSIVVFDARVRWSRPLNSREAALPHLHEANAARRRTRRLITNSILGAGGPNRSASHRETSAPC
jgi:hypothetical protein